MDKSFTAVGDSGQILANLEDTVTYAVTGTFVGTVVLQQFRNGGWSTIATLTTTGSGTFLAQLFSADKVARYRFHCSAYTSGTIVTSLSAAGASTPAVSGPVYSASVTLTHAQIKTLPTTGVEIVAAPGAGKRLMFLAAFGILDTTAGAYTIPADAALLIMSANGEYLGAMVKLAAASGQAASIALTWPQFADADAAGAFHGNVSVTALRPEDLVDQSLVVKDDYNGVVDYTDGHASNTLKITTLYAVVDV